MPSEASFHRSLVTIAADDDALGEVKRIVWPTIPTRGDGTASVTLCESVMEVSATFVTVTMRDDASWEVDVRPEY